MDSVTDVLTQHTWNREPALAVHSLVWHVTMLPIMKVTTNIPAIYANPNNILSKMDIVFNVPQFKYIMDAKHVHRNWGV